MERRHFMQFAGSFLATLGLSQANFLRQADRYGKAIAQSSPRKLALLIGINQYSGNIPLLNGCCTDVELQYELLVHRFGFNPKDIVRVWDNATSHDLKPTRENINAWFQEHLIRQAIPGDIVVVHFSGHGSQVRDERAIMPDGCEESQQLVGNQCPNNKPVSGAIVPSDRFADDDSIQDIPGQTLFLLSQLIQ